MENQAYLVVTGNPISGFSYFGPFRKEHHAQNWANEELSDDWWVDSIEPNNDAASFYDQWPPEKVKETHLRLGQALDDLGMANARIRQLEEDLQTSAKVIDRMAAGLVGVKIAAEEAMGAKSPLPDRFEDFFLDA